MACKLEQRDHLIIGYVEGILKPHLQKEFEAHYFLCHECFAQLQQMEQILPFMHREAEVIFQDKRGDEAR